MPEQLTPEEMQTCAKILRDASDQAPDEATKGSRNLIALNFEQDQIPEDNEQLMAASVLIYQESLRTNPQDANLYRLVFKLAAIYDQRQSETA